MPPNDDEFYAFAAEVVRKQRAAMEADAEERRKQRERELQAEMELLFMPRYLRYSRVASVVGEREQQRGLRLETIERRLFDGLPADAPTYTVRRRVRELGGELRYLAPGTVALLAGILDGAERGEAAGRRTFEKTRAEANRFGATRARSMLRDAGVDEEPEEPNT